eukprot:11595901-Heterocapsa_arctica.AAC.1
MVEGAPAVPLRDIQGIILLDVAPIISKAVYELDDGSARRRISRKLHLRWRHAPTQTLVRNLRAAGLPEEI